jgi:hypothetical protein
MRGSLERVERSYMLKKSMLTLSNEWGKVIVGGVIGAALTWAVTQAGVTAPLCPQSAAICPQSVPPMPPDSGTLQRTTADARPGLYRGER